MLVDEGARRRKSEAARLALEAAGRGARDERRIQHPTEVRNEFGRRRVSISGTNRPSTAGSHQPQHQVSSDQHGRSSGTSSSYFPQIQESYMSRDVREQKARLRTARSSLSSSSGVLSSRPFPSARGRLQSVRKAEAASPSATHKFKDDASIALQLDYDGMEGIHEAFQQLSHLDEQEFVTEMMASLKADKEIGENRAGMAGQLSELFRRIDLHARGVVTWDDFSAFISQTTDVASALEDTAINKYQADMTPSPLNFVAEIQGMIYLPGADQMVIHDTRGRSFQLYDPSLHRVRTACPQKIPHGPVVDAVYTPQGRYIVTASTSPVLSFYDLDSLQVRQQIPTKCFQTALALEPPSMPSNGILYSASSDGKVNAWDIASLAHRHEFLGDRAPGEAASITDIELLPASALLACASMDGKIYMLDLVAGRVAHTMSGHTKGVSMIKYCSENKYLVSGGIDHKLQVWNPHLEQKVGSLPGHRHQLVGLHVRPDSPEVITADSSGVMKIWDLRKFAAVQTIVKELYVKDHSSSASRPMTAMCYIDSHQRVAIAHSSIFFLDPVRPKSTELVTPSGNLDEVADNEADREVEKEEENKPLHVSFNAPSRSFIAITPWHVICWDAATGERDRSTPIPLGVEVISVAVLEDGYSCFVGCDDGSVARLILPSAAIVVHKRVHKSGGDISAIRLLEEERLVFTSGQDGNVIVSHWETLEMKYIINHWRGTHSARSYSPLQSNCDEPQSDSPSEAYSVPLALRSYFIGNEIQRLTDAFACADPQRSGKVLLSSLPSVLERAFPSSVSRPAPVKSDRDASSHDGKMLTFALFMETVKDTLSNAIVEGMSLSGASAFDAHSTLSSLVTASQTEGDFCVWNLKNAAVMGDGRVSVGESSTQVAPTSPPPSVPSSPPQRTAISIVRYLYPLPFFLCVEENSCRLSIWSSLATPPLTTRANMCILRYSHSHATGMEFRSRASTFLTEPKLMGKGSDGRAGVGNAPVVIRAVEWFFSEQDDKKLLCLGDEAGHIQLLDFKPLLRRIEEMKKHRPSTLLAFAPPGSPVAVDRNHDGLPNTLLQKVNRWSTTQLLGVGVRFVHVQNVDVLQQPNVNKRTLVVSVDDIGSVQVWSFDGQLLGRLRDDRSTTMSSAHWKLRLDAHELKQKTRDSAQVILQQFEQRKSVPRNQEEDDSGGSRRPSRTPHAPTSLRLRLLSVDQSLANSHTSHRVDRDQLRRTTMPSRPSGVSAQESLVAWRHSVHKKASGLQGRRSLRASGAHLGDSETRS